MKIEIWSDYVCPFCYIGKRRLESALEQFAPPNEVLIEYKSFELNPQASMYSGKSMHQILSEKHGMSLEQAKKAHAELEQQVAMMGLVYNIDQIKPTNTFDAHRLTQYAKSVGKDQELAEKLFYSYYRDAKLISDHDTLASIAESVGMNRDESIAVLHDSSKYASEVRSDEATAKQLGITGAPFFVIDRKYAISGAQPTEVFLKALNQASQEPFV
ncbi:DsbA family oxidoreductase [Paenibacillus polysaccharolyticus]|uniref:DsbA family oxidoreductase n=1 Tax=Paenibacillus polysaccharolyticus TaxID=582692 RepID=UPI00203EB828|nr:DsbA family oxidoreductase [Paenibacillus polysaccharolyticus]MCM3132864.1 DsbA family oxidoreductase [Paenibacillus polysaccharolyticus]